MTTKGLLNLEPFPQLVTERLVLRKPSLDDCNAVFKIRSDEKVMQYIGRPLMKSIQDGKEWLQNILDTMARHEAINWAITLKNDPVLIGTIGFWRIQPEHFRGEIGYVLDPEYQGLGIMHEAFEPVLNYGFQNMHLHSIEAQVHPDNLSSVRVLERNGFIREGYFRENFYFEGTFTDTAVYSLLADQSQAKHVRRKHVTGG